MSWLSSTAHQPLAAPAYLRTNAELAERARAEFPFAAAVPEDVYRLWVLPYRHYDEPVDDWRPSFFEAMEPHARGHASLREAAEAVIPRAWVDLGKHLEFKSNCTPAIMAPVSETLQQGHASCTGMSILLADALRSVGIPARVVGTALWNKPDGGNHNWVEVYHGEAEGWHFVDAVPGTTVEWDKTWFSDGQVQTAQPWPSLHGVYVHVWDATQASPAGANYTITWRDPHVELPAIDLTPLYTALPVH